MYAKSKMLTDQIPEFVLNERGYLFTHKWFGLGSWNHHPVDLPEPKEDIRKWHKLVMNAITARVNFQAWLKSDTPSYWHRQFVEKLQRVAEELRGWFFDKEREYFKFFSGRAAAVSVSI